MDILSLAELGETERRLLAIFVQFGRDGRALTTQSLAAIAGMAVDSKRLATALNNLAARGLIERGGGDPLPGSPIAFRLSRPMSRREGIEAIRHWRDPTPLEQIGRRDKPMPRNRVPAERPMHERGTPSSPCSHWLSVEPLTPPTRLTRRRACNSPGCRGLRPYVFWGGPLVFVSLLRSSRDADSRFARERALPGWLDGVHCVSPSNRSAGRSAHQR
jgi:hypothetical protein